jgi:hypothetical protein
MHERNKRVQRLQALVVWSKSRSSHDAVSNEHQQPESVDTRHQGDRGVLEKDGLGGGKMLRAKHALANQKPHLQPAVS